MNQFLLPSSGTLFGDTKTMVHPCKIGRVMWSRTPYQFMAPLDVHPNLTDNDGRNLTEVFEKLRACRAVTPVLEVIKNRTWQRMAEIKPYLIASLEVRSEARDMRIAGTWDEFWYSID